LPLDFDPDDCEDRPNGKAADITQRRYNQDPLAEMLEGSDGVLGLPTRRDLDGVTYGHARLISKWARWGYIGCSTIPGCGPFHCLIRLIGISLPRARAENLCERM